MLQTGPPILLLLLLLLLLLRPTTLVFRSIVLFYVINLNLLWKKTHTHKQRAIALLIELFPESDCLVV